MSSSISKRLLDWHARHGRKDLPWQVDRDPYKIWVSEIMLQQTQVGTVIPYFERFMDRFPAVQSLSNSSIDEVLHLWTGLGYYARARNLHRAAQIICRDYDGRFPTDANSACSLPGIGRSTANAILAFAFDQTLPILDGNAKRVLARHFRIRGWPGKKEVESKLWKHAENSTPEKRTADYTQAIMDLGATLCVRRQPLCTTCPIADTCQALLHGEQSLLPTPAPKREKPLRAVSMVMVRNSGSVLLEKRPPSGIWGGLWSFPEVEPGADVQHHIFSRFGLSIRIRDQWDVLRHSFTHFYLDITPVHAEVEKSETQIMENPGSVWYNLCQPDARGLAAPVKRLLNKLRYTMSRTVNCTKLGREAEGLDFPPWPGDLGKRVYESISKEAWQLWLQHQTMIINEYRLNAMDPKARELIATEMEKFFFGEGSKKPEGYAPPAE